MYTQSRISVTTISHRKVLIWNVLFHLLLLILPLSLQPRTSLMPIRTRSLPPKELYAIAFVVVNASTLLNGVDIPTATTLGSHLNTFWTSDCGMISTVVFQNNVQLTLDVIKYCLLLVDICFSSFSVQARRLSLFCRGGLCYGTVYSLYVMLYVSRRQGPKVSRRQLPKVSRRQVPKVSRRQLPKVSRR